MEELLGIGPGSVPIEAYVDNKSVVDAVHSTKLVEDKGLRLDVAALKQSLKKQEISKVEWCPGEKQIANCMTNVAHQFSEHFD